MCFRATPENAAIGNGFLDTGTQVIAKLFVMTVFSNKVRQMIEG